MSGWLVRAAAAWGRPIAPTPQPYDVACDCGEHLTGWRTETHQKLNCTTCDRPLLVLPASVYPAVKRSTMAPPVKKSNATVQPQDPETESRRDSGSKKKKSREQSAAEPAGKSTAKAAEKKETAETVERIDLSPMLQTQKARRRSFRLVIVSILALVAVTGWSLLNRTKREHARSSIPAAAEAGMAALRSGDFPKAVRELKIAAEGVDVLHRTDAASETIRQAHREAVAAEGLLDSDFIQIATAVATGFGSTDERRKRFQADYGSKWLLFDVGLVRSPASDRTAFELDVPLLIGDHALQIQIDQPQLRRLTSEAGAQTAVRAIFAAQIDDWQIPESPTRPVVARLKGSTAVLWSDYDSYLAVGYRPVSEDAERETRALLQHQRQLGVTP